MKIKIAVFCFVVAFVSPVAFSAMPSVTDLFAVGDGKKLDKDTDWRNQSLPGSSATVGIYAGHISNVVGLQTAGTLTFANIYYGANNKNEIHGTFDLGADGKVLATTEMQLDSKSETSVGLGLGSYLKLISGTLGMVAANDYRFLVGANGPSNTMEANGSTATIDLGNGAVWLGHTYGYNQILVKNGATMNGAFCLGGANSGATHNLLMVEGEGSTLTVPSTTAAGVVFVGAAGGNNRLVVTNGASLNIAKAVNLCLGYDWTSYKKPASEGNEFLVSDKARATLSGALWVGANSGNNLAEISGGSAVAISGGIAVGVGTSDYGTGVHTVGNKLVIKGKGTRVDDTGCFTCGDAKTEGDVVEISDGAVVTNSTGGLRIGNAANSRDNRVTVSGGAKLCIVSSGSNRSYVGNYGSGSSLVVDGGTFEFDTYLQSAAQNGSVSNRIAVVNGGDIRGYEMIVGDRGDGSSLVISNGTINAFRVRLGLTGGTNTRLVVGGTNATVNLSHSFVASTSSRLEFGVPDEKWSSPIVQAPTVTLNANTTIKVTVDPGLKRGGRVVLMKADNAIDLSNVTWDLPPRARVDTSNAKEVAVRVPGNQGLMIVIK